MSSKNNWQCLKMRELNGKNKPDKRTLRQLADSVRMVNLESIEKEYRKQDSLYLVTSIKLDEAVRGRLESNDQLTNKLMDIIKSGIDPNADPDLSFPPQQVWEQPLLF